MSSCEVGQVMRSLAQDVYTEHDIEQCSTCYFAWLMAQVAKEFVEKEEFTKETIKQWSTEVDVRWRASKFNQMYEEASKLDIPPAELFKIKGLEM